MSSHDLLLKFELISNLAEQWPHLFKMARKVSPFLSYEWFQSLAAYLIQKDPKVLVFYDGKKPVGILPASLIRDSLSMVGDDRVTDINGLLHIAGYEKKIITALSDLIRSRDLKLDIYPLEKDDPLVSLLPATLGSLEIHDVDPCPILRLPESWNEYLKMLDGKSHHELRRKLKRASNFEFKTVDANKIDLLFGLMSVSDKDKRSFLRLKIRDFFRSIAQSFAKKQWLRYRAIMIDSKPVGTIFSFQIKKRVYVYNMGFDPAYARLSPGIILVALDIRSAIEEGIEYYDFLRGDDGYKLRFGSKIRYTVRIRR